MENIENNSTYIFWIRLPRDKTWVWLTVICPAVLSFSLQSLSLIADGATACGLIMYAWPGSAFAAICIVYLPVISTLVLKPPIPPQRTLSLVEAVGLLLKLLGYIAVYPILVSIRLLKRLLATVKSLNEKKSNDEILSQYEQFLSREIHSYLFLKAFFHNTPQALLQLSFLISGTASNTFIVFTQLVSVLVSLVSLTVCVVSYHRYEAQVIGGRTADLLIRPPEDSDPQRPNTTISLLPIKFCLRSKIISLPADCPMGRLVAFAAWFCLIFSRLLCLVVSYQIYPGVTMTTLFAHLCFMLFYLLSSQSTSLYDIPSRLLHAVAATVVLLEVSVRFYKLPLLYSLFCVCIFVEDTYMMVLFYVYQPISCSNGRVNCKLFGVYAYLVLNLHIIGVILFGIYLAKLRPLGKYMVPNPSISSTVTNY